MQFVKTFNQEYLINSTALYCEGFIKNLHVEKRVIEKCQPLLNF